MRASQVLADIRVSAKILTLDTAVLGKETITHSIIRVSSIVVMHLYS